ncbi:MULTISPECIES: hypothetical protein [Corynebacterium]|uniref:hypothetical protein n=1 Tax=Corynebacterium TaxID=1716 RepID=UPI0008A15F1B|nr:MULTISPECIES: hypothetical protein [Corynebacterium]MBE7337988.1 hypothetical protein [Corynebacterium aurimucosum]MBE7363899.1 hypothetical protein [Corynebacterium aurimucosum]MBU5654903.1 hypothetical protein [Corynebacterium aurimucosum]MDK6808357.1 hypothetical protein [Corynebacterium aurimucosum]NJJ84245.1 hypothetical protein [Corynebacterium aurimucosum]
MRTSLAVAAAALALFSAPIASAAEAPAETTVDTATENTESTGFTFYKSFGREFADHFRCSTSPQRWWCG